MTIDDKKRIEEIRRGEFRFNCDDDYQFLLAKLDEAHEDFRYIIKTAGLEEPEFGNLRPLAYAARLGLIDIRARKALGEE